MESREKVEERGLILVHTGGGKGKTTAALGLALRAVGYGQRVRVIQFIKGDWHAGELTALERLAPEVELTRVGLGFFGIMGDDRPEEAHRQAAAQGLAEAARELASGRWFLVILDEVNNALHEGLIEWRDVSEALEGRSPGTNVCLTGRDAPCELLAMADLVTEMREVKHPFSRGILAREGIDY